MKFSKIIIILVAITSVLFFTGLTSPVSASNTGLWKDIDKCEDPRWDNVNNEFITCEPPGLDDVEKLIYNGLSIALGLVGTIALIYLIYGGVTYMTSGGNPDKVGQAKNTIFYAILGIVLTILSWSIITYIIKSIK